MEGEVGGKCHQFLLRGQFLPLLQLYDITLITAVELNRDYRLVATTSRTTFLLNNDSVVLVNLMFQGKLGGYMQLLEKSLRWH